MQAITEVCEFLKAANIKKIYGVNYSIAYPIYVLSKGKIRVEELGFSELNGTQIDELLSSVKKDPETAIVYRLCGCKEGDPNWISWLNHDPQIYALIRSVESQRSSLDLKTIRDSRRTEFVVIRKAQTVTSPNAP
ncbi:MAG: hypothetical protein JXA73_19615 [Acidobacteria bacterium]|nr:hypothetical protein [Acidobacteriota bacterium]